MTESENYPFYTERIDGQEKAGVRFIPSTGEFLEFVDPESHDCWAIFRNPRTGKEIGIDGPLDDALRSAVAGHIASTVPADKWQETREKALTADSDRIEWAKDKMVELTPDPPAETGVKQETSL